MQHESDAPPNFVPQDGSDHDKGAQGERNHGTRAKLVRMANQIATFFETKPHAMGVAGVAEHINKFWDPRMRGLFWAMLDDAGMRETVGFRPLVLEAAEKIRRPGEKVSPAEARQANAGVPGDKGEASGETKSRIAASQG